MSMLQINKTLTYIDVSWNGFGNEGAAAFAEALCHNEVLTYIDLSSNRIGLEGARKIAHCLSSNSALLTLKVK